MTVRWVWRILFFFFFIQLFGLLQGPAHSKGPKWKQNKKQTNTSYCIGSHASQGLYTYDMIWLISLRATPSPIVTLPAQILLLPEKTWLKVEPLKKQNKTKNNPKKFKTKTIHCDCRSLETFAFANQSLIHVFLSGRREVCRCVWVNGWVSTGRLLLYAVSQEARKAGYCWERNWWEAGTLVERGVREEEELQCDTALPDAGLGWAGLGWWVPRVCEVASWCQCFTGAHNSFGVLQFVQFAVDAFGLANEKVNDFFFKRDTQSAYLQNELRAKNDISESGLGRSKKKAKDRKPLLQVHFLSSPFTHPNQLAQASISPSTPQPPAPPPPQP